MLIVWALFLQLVLVLSTRGQKLEEFFAQDGGSVVLPKGKWSETESVYVKWYFSSTGIAKDNLLIWKTPRDTPKLEGKEEWQNRISLSEDSSLIVSPVQPSDFGGLFKCEQDNYKGSHTVEYRLIRVPMPTELLLVVGEEFSLKCETEAGVAVPNVNWKIPNSTNDGTRIRNKNVVRVLNSSIRDSGVWECLGPREFKATTTVTVLDLSPSSETVYTSASLATSATLPCSLSAPVSWPQLKEKGLQGGSWSFTPLNQANQQNNQVLTLELKDTQAWSDRNITSCLSNKALKNHDLSVQIQRVSTACRGKYQCSLKFNSGRTMSKTVELEVLEVLSSAPVGVALLEGDPLNLNCSLGVSLPSDLHVKWTPPKSSTFPQPQPHQVNLSLPVVSVKDSGRWKCELKKGSTVLASASVILKIEKLVDTWVIVTIVSAWIFIMLLVITVVIICRRRKVSVTRQRKTRFCCCKNPQPKGFYKT